MTLPLAVSRSIAKRGAGSNSVAKLEMPILTFTLEQETRAKVTEWAREEGRPVSNLLRNIVDRACTEHRGQREQQQSQSAVA